jgi:hypothetical protein
MINPQWGFNPMNKIIIRMLFAVTLFQHGNPCFEPME